MRVGAAKRGYFVIVECQNCDTRFQLDDERIPITGIRVRCSRCKEAFFLQHPEASRSETVDAIAADAVAQVSGGPEPAEDLGGSAFDDLADDGTGGLVGGDDVEEDWEFNHDTPDPAADASAAVPNLFDANDSSGLELASDSPASESAESREEPEAKASAPASVEFDGSFGSVDDFGSLSDDATAEADAPETGSALESDISDVIDSLASLNVDDAQPEAEPTAVAGDLGEPEDWDLLGDDGEDLFFGDAAEPTPMRVSAEASAPAVVDEPHARSVPRTAGGAPRMLERAGAAVGWLAFAALFAAALYSGVMGSVPIDRGANRYAVGSLEADSVEMSWATVGGGETLLVVRGVLHNRTDASRIVGVSVAVDLLDATGRRLERAPALAARPFALEELRTLAPDERTARVSTGAAALARERISNGESIDFAAYFAAPPETARRVSVRAQEIGEESFEAPWRDEPSGELSERGEAGQAAAGTGSLVAVAQRTTVRALAP